MTDFANLVMSIDSRDVKSGVSDLDRLTTAGTKAEKAIDRLGDETAQTGRQIKTAGEQAAVMARNAQSAASRVAGVGGASRLASHHMANLTYQVNDVVQGFAMGQRPMQIFAQQGFQIGQIAQQAGIGIGGLVKNVVGMMGRFVMAHPILSAFAVAAGLAAGAMNLLTSELNRTAELDAYAASLGLTKKEMKELDGVGVTFGDTLSGLWRTIDQGLGVSTVFSAIKTWAVDTFKTALDWTKKWVSATWAAFAGTANAAIAMGKATKQALTGDFAGALETVRAIPAAYEKAFQQSQSAIDGFIARWKTNTVAAARDRIAAQAKDLIDDRTEKALKDRGKAVGKTFADAMVETIEETMRKLRNMKPIITASDIFKGKTLNDTVAAAQEAERQRIEGERRVKEFYEEMHREQRETFLNGAYDFADIVGGTFGRAIRDLADALDRGFAGLAEQIGGGMSAKLSGIFKQMSAGAQIGNASASIMKSLGIKTSQTGAEIGGALGSFAGPIGAIAGSILGGVVGGLFKKTKKASATIEIIAGNAMQSSLTGNSSKLKAVAGALADSLIGGLMGIADQLGGVLGDGLRVSIGQRKKTFRVDLAGLGRTKNMPKFDTEEEAIAFAIQSVIRQGAITGLRAGTEALLKGAGDLEAQLQKALSFENVFRELENRANPAKAAIDAITKEFTALIDIFEEAGASAEDYASLQELMAIRQREAIETAFAPIRSMLDDLKGKADQAGDAVQSAAERVFAREASAIEAYASAVAAQRQEQASILRSQASEFASMASRLRDFAGSVFGVTAGSARFSMAAVNAAAQAGDVSALQAQRDAATSTATSRVEAMRRLAQIRNAATGAAGGFESQASLAEQQAAALVGIEDSASNMAALLADMQTATAAADIAREQMEALGLLTETELSFADAVAAYEEAKAARDDLMRGITEAGFAGLIEAQQQTGAQMLAALSATQAAATKAASDAAAAIAAAQAAAAAVNDNSQWMFNGIDLRTLNIPGFASGGMHMGGLRVVGEHGPEIEATGPARIWTADQIGGDRESAAEMRAMRQEMKEQRALLYQIAKTNSKMLDIERTQDVIGLPPTRAA